MATNEQPTEEQLKEQLDNICLEYQDLIDKSKDMAPKETKNVDPKSDGALEEDIQGRQQFLLDYGHLVHFLIVRTSEITLELFV